MQVLDRLQDKCCQLGEVTRMTETLHEKLNRTEGSLKDPEDPQAKQVLIHRDIVELFDAVADKMEEQIQTIGNNTAKSMAMID